LQRDRNTRKEAETRAASQDIFLTWSFGFGSMLSSYEREASHDILQIRRSIDGQKANTPDDTPEADQII
jgi:hypothetical protein